MYLDTGDLVRPSTSRGVATTGRRTVEDDPASHPFASPPVRSFTFAQYIDVLSLLTTREVVVRYRQSLLGPAWAVVQPLAMMLLFTVVFGVVLGVEGPAGVPYPLFLFAGLIPFQLFQNVIQRGASAVTNAGPLVTKVAVPLDVFPTAAFLHSLFDALLTLGIFAVIAAVYALVGESGVRSSAPLAVAFVLLAGTLALGAAYILSALVVFARDVYVIVPLLVQVLMFASPVVYDIERVPAAYLGLYRLNPLAVAVEGVRAAMFGRTLPPTWAVAWAAIVAVGLLWLGRRFFKRLEPVFADVL